MVTELNDDTFLLYAAKAYDRPNAIMSELEEDLKRIKYIKRLIRRYKASGILKERLILNHLIVLYNVFGAEPATRILFFKIDMEDWDVLKTFLIFLSFMPPIVVNINKCNIRSSDIPVNQGVANTLRMI